MISFGSV